MIECAKCGSEKPRSDYYTNKSRASGHDQYCKSCRRGYIKSWSKTPQGKAARAKSRRDSYLRNATKEAARSSQWRRGKRLGTPDWLTERQLSEIEHFYFVARDCSRTSGEAYHVDHIVPLCGENVCGLHVPWNLQVLPSDLNMSKGNKIKD